MAKVDAELRDTGDRSGREVRANHTFATRHEGKRYPGLQFVAEAAGAAPASHSI